MLSSISSIISFLIICRFYNLCWNIYRGLWITFISILVLNTCLINLINHRFTNASTEWMLLCWILTCVKKFRFLCNILLRGNNVRIFSKTSTYYLIIICTLWHVILVCQVNLPELKKYTYIITFFTILFKVFLLYIINISILILLLTILSYTWTGSSSYFWNLINRIFVKNVRCRIYLAQTLVFLFTHQVIETSTRYNLRSLLLLLWLDRKITIWRCVEHWKFAYIAELVLHSLIFLVVTKLILTLPDIRIWEWNWILANH